MLTVITIIHLIITVCLVAVVLLQDPKGGAMGLTGGGGMSQSVFGATGASTFLVQATKYLAIAFGITCIMLTYYTSNQSRSVVDGINAPAVVNPTQTPAEADAHSASGSTEKAPETTEKPAQ